MKNYFEISRKLLREGIFFDNLTCLDLFLFLAVYLLFPGGTPWIHFFFYAQKLDSKLYKNFLYH